MVESLGQFRGSGHPISRVEAIVRAVSLRIDAGALQSGDRLASIRKAALEHRVSKNTMAEAYDSLVALGRIEARPGSGYYVRSKPSAQAAQPRKHVVEALDC